MIFIVVGSSEFINGDVVGLAPGLTEGLLEDGGLFALTFDAGIEGIIAFLEALFGGSISVASLETHIMFVAAGGQVLLEGVEDGIHLSLHVGASAAVGGCNVSYVGLECFSLGACDVLGII